MAQECPVSVDIQEIQFKIHNKYHLFNEGSSYRNHVNLLTSSNTQGLLFAGSPHAAELRVVMLKNLVDTKGNGDKLLVRQVGLPSFPNSISCSADGIMLAINYTLNNSAFMQIFSVSSFLTPNVTVLHQIRLATEENVFALQLLWNPVITNSLAVVLSNGAMNVYTLKDGGQFEIHTLDKSQQVECASWSPKGKQIVLGFPNGKLQQFKPDLTPMKTIVCPPNVHPGPFDTIALHWLSTYQFVAIFLQQSEEASPQLYVINAPKGGASTYINYYDPCYSGNFREQQFSFTHVPQWNILLVTSANGVEVGVLGTHETGETPTWQQYSLLDEARIELPLTADKEETYPLGFVFDIATAHQLTINEKLLPVMPMIHVLSTGGELISFNFLNFVPNAANICSPPAPITDLSHQFITLDQLYEPSNIEQEEKIEVPAITAADMSINFSTNPLTSTPTSKEKPISTFGLSSAGGLFGQNAPLSITGVASVAPATTVTSSSGFTLTPVATISASNQPFGRVSTTGFTGFGTETPGLYGTKSAAPLISGGFSGAAAKPVELTMATTTSNAASIVTTQPVTNKPLYTVQPVFTPPSATIETSKSSSTEFSGELEDVNSTDMDETIKTMINIQIISFDNELKQLRNSTAALNLGDISELKNNSKRLQDLQEITEQANDRGFELDVQHLRQSLSESYAMLTECRTKLDLYNNPDIKRLTSVHSYDPINRREIAKLRSSLTINEAQLHLVQQKIDEQWSDYQDVVRRKTKSRMHIPCLDGIYQRMIKIRDLISRQRIKIDSLKTKLKQKGLLHRNLNETVTSSNTSVMSDSLSTIAMDSFTDSMLSISIHKTIDLNRSQLSPEKAKALRSFTQQLNKVQIVKPMRPDRVDLKSEVIIETKLRSERKIREGATTNLMKMQQQQQQQQHQQQLLQEQQQQKIIKPKATTNISTPVTQLAKPTATKPTATAIMTSQTSFASPTNSQPNISFGSTSPFVKTSATSTMTPQPSFVLPTIGQPNFSFGSTSPFVKTSSISSTPQQPKSTSPPLKPFSTGSNVSGQFSNTAFNVGENPITSFAPAMPTSASFGQVKSATSANPMSNVSFASTITTTAKPAANVEAQSQLFSQSTTIGSGTTSTLSVSNANKEIPSNILAALPSTTSVSFTPKTITNAATITNTTSTSAAPSTAFTADKENVNLDNPVISKPFAVPPGGSLFSGLNLGTAANNANKSSFFAANNKPDNAASAFSFGNLTPSISSNITSVSTSVAPANVTITKIATTTSNVAPIFGASAIVTKSENEPTPTTINVSTTKPLTFTGFDKSNVEGNLTQVTAITTTTETFSNNTPTTAPTAVTTDSADMFLNTLSICKPSLSTDEENKSTGNIFSGFGLSSEKESGTNIFAMAIASTAPNPMTTSITFGSTADTPTTTAAALPTTAADTAATIPPNVTAPSSFLSYAPPGSLFGTSALTTPTVTVTVTAATTTITTTTTAATISAAGTVPSLFSSFSITTGTTSAVPTVAVTTTTSTAGSIFGGAAATSTPSATGNLFGGIPKPDQSVFGSATSNSATSPSVGIFASAAASNPSPTAAFGATSPPPGATGGSIFAPTSPFGGFASNAPAASIFGGNTAAKPAEGASIFGGTASSPVAGGSLFGQAATFGQTAAPTGSNIFGGGQQQQAPAFGTTPSIFGGATASPTAASGGSLFGGGSSGTSLGFGSFSASTTGGFGNAPGGFGSPASSSFGATSGGSIAQTGFGSAQPQTSPFSKPVFGGAATFGSPPTFGATSSFGGSPSFGGAPTFGSPKGFGTFNAPANTTTPGSFGTPTQKNSLFETLGASDTGLSFGNLAQNTNPNTAPQPPKPAFGGSSFMNYRA